MSANELEYQTVSTTICIIPKGEPVFSELATFVGVDDESAGPFVTITQRPGKGEQVVCLTVEEWPIVRDAVEQMFVNCKALG